MCRKSRSNGFFHIRVLFYTRGPPISPAARRTCTHTVCVPYFRVFDIVFSPHCSSPRFPDSRNSAQLRRRVEWISKATRRFESDPFSPKSRQSCVVNRFYGIWYDRPSGKAGPRTMFSIYHTRQTGERTGTRETLEYTYVRTQCATFHRRFCIV